MNGLTEHENSIKVLFICQKTELVEEVTLNAAQLTALINAKQEWIEKFSNNLRYFKNDIPS